MPLRLRLVQGLLHGVLATLTALSAGAVRAPEAGTLLPDFDARLDEGQRLAAVVALSRGASPESLLAGPVATPGERQQSAALALAREAGPLEVRWSEITGSPSLLFARSGALTRPDARPAKAVAIDFVLRHHDLWALAPDQARALEVDAIVPTSDGGSVVHFHQRVSGRHVDHGHLAVGVTADGRVLAVHGGGVTGTGAGRTPALVHDAAAAMVQMARAVGLDVDSVPQGVVSPDGSTTFRVPGLRADVSVSPIAIQAAHGPRLAWQGVLQPTKGGIVYEVIVDDATLLLVRRATRTWFFDTRGRVFANNPGVSTHDLVRFVDSADYPADSSRSGWADEGGGLVVTAGNNTYVQDDLAADDEATPGLVAIATPPGPFVAFDFPYSADVTADADASLTSLFHWINVAHDWTWGLGFDEASGNFQIDNGARGGLAGDPVLGDDRDGSDVNNANFATFPDGIPSRMQMFVWDRSGTPRSSSFEAGIVIHEFGHGVSTRLVGGPAHVTCLFGRQGASMGEGWSDYLAASFLEDTVVGAWASGDPDGIRLFRLDENPTDGTKDYRNFCNMPGDVGRVICEPHANGEIWSGLLWRIREEYIALHGAAGRRMIDQLVIDAMKYTPCMPSMLDARDALILADRLKTGGEHECLIKEVARERFMGSMATTDGGSDPTPSGDDTAWPECGTAGVVRFDREGLEAGQAQATYSCDDVVGVVVVDGNAPGATVRVTLATSGGDSESLDLARGAAPATFLGSIPSERAPASPGDLRLQVGSGDTVTVTYVDGVNSPTSRAAVACAPRIEVARHRVARGSCDADVMPGYPQLPGFVDRGESADVIVTLANLVPKGIAGVVSVTVDRPDLLTVMPASPIPFDLRVAMGTSPAEDEIALRVVGSDTIMAGDVVTLSLAVSSPGWDPITLQLPLELQQDYRLVTGLELEHDVEAESAPVGPAWTTGTLRAGTNQWTVVTCANTTPAGRQAYHDGPANCTANYSDAQGNPWLAAPAMNLFTADTRAARILRTSWMNDITLGVAGGIFGAPLAFDADAVVVTLTNDPTQLDVSDPPVLALTSLAFYIHVEFGGFVINSNTMGFEPEAIDVLPQMSDALDLSRPAYIVWTFLPDASFVQPPFDAQARGYFVDDVRIEYERIDAVPQAAACTAATTVFAVPRIAQPVPAATCPGSAVTVDASASESTLCGPPSDLDYRFLVGGLPVACALDPSGMPLRVQDVDGWGLGPTCVDFPTTDTTYDVEVRCRVAPDVTDVRPTSVRVVVGRAILGGSPRAFCPSNPQNVVLDLGGSVVVGCPGVIEYLYQDAAGGPLDCDGDGLPDGFRADPTCLVAASAPEVQLVVSVRCADLPACTLTETVTVPVVSVTAVAAEATPAPGGYWCRSGTAPLTGASSILTGCDDGQAAYRWTTTRGEDSGWTSTPTFDVAVPVDLTATLEVRCSLDPACTSTDTIDLRARTGTFSYNTLADRNCVGDPLTLSATPRNVRCDAPGAVEYRFVLAGSPVACGGRTQDVDGWGTAGTCDTVHVAGSSDYVVEMRCSDDPSCIIDAGTRTITPRTGLPTGMNVGSLRVRKSEAGCAATGDVRLSWGDTDHAPPVFVVRRADEPRFMPATFVVPVDDVIYADVDVACDGGGVPYPGPRGLGQPVAVYFYLHNARNECTGEIVP